MVAFQAPLLRLLTALLLLPAILLAGCAGSSEPAPDDAANDTGDQAVAPPLDDSDARSGSGDVADVLPAWPDLTDATIRPGGFLNDQASYDGLTPGGGCTSNFVFYDARDGRIFLGTAAHCFQPADAEIVSASGTCERSMPLGTPVHVDGADAPARLAYSSRLAMEAARESSYDVCLSNDFALLTFDPADAANVHPAMLTFGGPVALADEPPGDGATVLTHGASPDRYDTHDSAAGRYNRTRHEGWTHVIDFLPLRIPGDSGSGVLTQDGQALGVIRSITGNAHNEASDLRHMLTYAREATGWDLRLATWNEFDGTTLLPPPPAAIPDIPSIPPAAPAAVAG